jgi:RNA polymerase sigma-70 factor (ECF subfamily)
MSDVEPRALLEREHADAFNWALACCRGDRDAAEEAVQTAYLTVLDGTAIFDGRSSFRTWLFGVIRLTAASQRRRALLRRLLLERGRDRVPAPTNGSTADIAEHSSRAMRLQAALRRLPERQRQVLLLTFYHDLTVEQAASVMGISVGSARTHSARGKARLALLVGGSAR